jgi:tRNA (uracil-5-)-methyltransferase TRM9
VQAFVDKALSSDLPEISEFKKLNVLEVGCGNGKNLEYISKTYPNVHVSGCDMCEKFVEITSKKGIDCCVADNLKLPYAPGEFDVVLSVAVIHHFSTQERRIQAIQELFRVLKPGGKLFIQVWALEQPPKSKRHFATQDEFVPWKGTSLHHTAERKRYYHLFKKGELE